MMRSTGERHLCRRRYCVFYMWLRVLRSRKVPINSDGDNIIIIIIGFLGLSYVFWYYFGCVGISLVVIPSVNVDGK